MEPLSRLAISQSELFLGWPAEAIARLVSSAEVLSFEPGICVLRTGDPAKNLWLIASGSVNLLSAMPGERIFTARLQLAGDFHGLGPVMGQGHYRYTAVCREPSVLIRIPGELLLSLIAADGRLALSLFKALDARHKLLMGRHASASVNSMQARVAEVLASIISRSTRSFGADEISLSQHEIASMIGTRRQVVQRVLRAMELAGVIRTQYGRIVILDREGLDRMAIER